MERADGAFVRISVAGGAEVESRDPFGSVSGVRSNGREDQGAPNRSHRTKENHRGGLRF